MSSYTEYHKRYYESKVKGQRAAKREALQKEIAEVNHIIECLHSNDPVKWYSCRLKLLDELYVRLYKLQIKFDNLKGKSELS